MGNDKVIVELLFVLSLLSLSLTFFPELIKDSVDEMGYFKGNRASENFNVLGIPKENKIEFYTMSGSRSNISITDFPNGSPISRAMLSLYKRKKRFSIYIDEKARSVSIYSESVIPKYIFKMKEVPKRSLTPAETIKGLDRFYLPNGPMDQKLIETLVYLELRGCLEDKLFILYENTLILINEEKQMIFFDIDLEHLFGMMVEEVVSQTERKDGSNRLLIAFKVESNIFFLFSPGDEQKGFGRRITGNTLSEGSIKLFPSSRDVQIKNAVSKDDYVGISKIISDEERKEGIEVLKKLIIDPFRSEDLSFFR
ncbi:uncharacterized protein Eint_111420 [Encephalitozoon intestinalis ATCC 50506]|uniref:Uncharacterized protein n=1 Tax=Encephalitozoon intestinalis (strain ATCC 50506) TaxID=876142 RepID=E0SA19_ENCIT|nr:uncharacterized protein Eint_111420 [Encephalitozoon intestinalis ATCC 50506]ADM12641.1 hypothetical protein Eint_111420 [Encephalitozoon intestinalis ATCC 50506]UTX46501.1 DNA polymerase III beta subunit-like protein [Encephalitozoon intestinalis]